MANKVFVNMREISCKSAAGKSICAFPDVCFTPPQTPATPPGVPIPYPNTGMASDTTSGSKKVKVSGKEVMLKDKSYFKQSVGDEAGSAPKKGLITSKNKGKVFFTVWSMDVKVEGENAVRALDLTTHNHSSQPPNTPPWPHVDAIAPPAPPAPPVARGTVNVKVVDKCNGDGVEGADVEVALQSKKTNSSGTATFPNLEPNAYAVLVHKQFSEADYVTFIVHYPKVTSSHKAESGRSETVSVGPGQTVQARIEIEVFRLVSGMVFHRRHIDLRGEDKYGHWWTVLGNGMSFGWWPKYPLGSPQNRSSEPPTEPAPLPPSAGTLQRIQHAFSSAVYAVRNSLYGMRESSLVQTLFGVEGELNGQTSFGGSPTKDPHDAGGDSGDDQFHPVVHDCRTDDEIRTCMQDFAQSYHGEWSWRFELGNHCHTFQKRLMSHCNTKEVK